MGTYWDEFVSVHKVNIVWEWTYAQTLKHYTDWLVMQPGYAEFLRQRHLDQQQAHADFNYEGVSPSQRRKERDDH